MDLKAVTRKAWFLPAVGAVLTVLCGFILQQLPIGEKWEHASYDYLFRFGSYPTTNVVLIAMDDAAYGELRQNRNKFWDRGLHAQLVNKLAVDRCPLVVFDIAFDPEGASTNDNALAAAMRNEGHVVLREKTAEPSVPGAVGHTTLPPQKIFVDAAAGLGIAEADEDTEDRARSTPKETLSVSFAAREAYSGLDRRPSFPQEAFNRTSRTLVALLWRERRMDDPELPRRLNRSDRVFLEQGCVYRSGTFGE